MDSHRLADVFPLLTGEAFEELVADIRTQGQHEPVWTYEGKILDGRNRWLACERLGIELVTRPYEGTDPLGFVVSLNLKRRHLNESQRALIAGEIANIKHGGAGKNHEKSEGQICLSEAAEKLNVSERSVKTAKQVKRNATDNLYRKVKDGELRLSVASDIASLPREEQDALLAKADEKAVLDRAKVIRGERERARRQERMAAIVGKEEQELDTRTQYPVIYADPPWCYERDVSGSRALDNQYPVMTLQAIQNLPVRDLATETAILFLWATGPKLVEAISVMDAWGFHYRSCAVWDKQVLGMGYWFRQQTELLLVGIRGDMPTPDPADRVSSLLSVKRGRHSEKPEEVYRMIEGMYPCLPRIELFSRNRREGWSVFGNEVPATA